MNKLILVSLVTLLTACAGMSPQKYNEIMTVKVKERASFDFQCDKKDIAVQKIGVTSFGATGCGKKASYVGITSDCSSPFEGPVTKYCEIASDNFAPDQKETK